MARKVKTRYPGLSSSQFGLPSQKKYPINTVKRARNALARAAQHATPSQRAQIRRRVHAKYPSIKVSGMSSSRSRRRR